MKKNLQKVTGEIMLMKDYGIKPNFSDLERKYGLDRHTIKKIYENGGIQPRKPRTGLSKWDPYYNEIVKFCNQGGCTKRSIHEYLKHEYGEENLPGNYNSFKAYTYRKKIQIKKSEKKPHPLYETEMGRVLQADFKEDLKFTFTNGEVIEFNVFSATLGYSREHVFIYTKNKTRDDFLRCTVKAYRKLGGITEEFLTDNAAAVVNHQTGKVLPEVSQFFKDIGVDFKTCKVRTPETKGKIERFNKTLKGNTINCEEWSQYKTIDDVNLRIGEYIKNDYHMKSHGTTETDDEGNLLNARERFLRDVDRHVYRDDEEIDQIFLHRVKRKVRTDATIRYNNKFYEVPMGYIGDTVTLVIDPFESSRAWITTDEDEKLLPISILDRKANHSVKRRQYIKMGDD